MSAVVGGLVAALLFYLGVLEFGERPGNVAITGAAQQDSSGSVDPGGEGGPSVREVYNRDGPGVVTVDVSAGGRPGGGSGFVVDDRGYIVTNQHVVADADSVSVRFPSEARQEAEVVGEDPSTDTAVLRVDAPGEALQPLTLGDSDSVGVGDPVIAIGNPLNVGISVTTGIVSGIGRPIPAPNRYTINGAVQTDAAISSGNSGGPLIDASGKVVGVTSQAASAGPFTGGVAQGVGFAVPINTVKNVVDQLISGGEVQHGYMGVSLFPVSVEDLSSFTGFTAGELSEQYGLPESGAIVSEVTEGGPADEAGIRGGEDAQEIGGLPVRLGDVITEAEGKTISKSDDLIELINSLKPGDSLNLTVVTPGEEPREVEVTLGVQPNQ